MKVSYYFSTTTAMQKIPVETGNVIFSSNDKNVYIDGPAGRVCFNGITKITTEAKRASLTNTYSGFYYVGDTKKFWIYFDNEWICLGGVGGDDVEKQIEFMTYDDFPAMGQSNKLYVDGASMYVWSDEDEDYVLISGSSDQDWIDV